MCVRVYVRARACACAWARVCVCVCVCERERGREREGETDTTSRFSDMAMNVQKWTGLWAGEVVGYQIVRCWSQKG